MTHINAYQAEVEVKKQAAVAAQQELATAEAALKDHPDFVAPKVVKVKVVKAVSKAKKPAAKKK